MNFVKFLRTTILQNICERQPFDKFLKMDSTTKAQGGENNVIKTIH